MISERLASSHRPATLRFPESSRGSVSRLEKRSDLLISTLRKRVKAMGRDVRIVAEFPDRAPFVLSELSEDDPPHKSSSKRAHAPT